MTPPLPRSNYFVSSTGSDCYTEDQTKAYGKACAAAEQDRILRIVYSQSLAYGKTGECMWIGVKSHVRNGDTKTDWSAA